MPGAAAGRETRAGCGRGVGGGLDRLVEKEGGGGGPANGDDTGMNVSLEYAAAWLKGDEVGAGGTADAAG